MTDYNAGYNQAINDVLEVCREQRRLFKSHHGSSKGRKAIGWVMQKAQELNIKRKENPR